MYVHSHIVYLFVYVKTYVISPLFMFAYRHLLSQSIVTYSTQSILFRCVYIFVNISLLLNE